MVEIKKGGGMMSEFTCINRHELGYGEFRCKVCGGRVYYMDGLDPQESAEIPEYTGSDEAT